MGVKDCFCRYLSSTLLAIATYGYPYTIKVIHISDPFIYDRTRFVTTPYHEKDEPCGKTLNCVEQGEDPPRE